MSNLVSWSQNSSSSALAVHAPDAEDRGEGDIFFDDLLLGESFFGGVRRIFICLLFCGGLMSVEAAFSVESLFCLSGLGAEVSFGSPCSTPVSGGSVELAVGGRALVATGLAEVELISSTSTKL